jgi:hypothetical protein
MMSCSVLIKVQLRFADSFQPSASWELQAINITCYIIYKMTECAEGVNK